MEIIKATFESLKYLSKSNKFRNLDLDISSTNFTKFPQNT